LTMEAGRSTTSPAAIWLATKGGKMRIAREAVGAEAGERLFVWADISNQRLYVLGVEMCGKWNGTAVKELGLC
jgi:hypothetical protein